MSGILVYNRLGVFFLTGGIMKQGKWILLSFLLLGMAGCYSDEEMTIPKPEEFRQVGPQCSPGFSKLADGLTVCPADRTCETLSDGTTCIERLIDTSGGAGINCDAGWITVSQSEFTNKEAPMCFAILEDDELDDIEERYNELPKNDKGEYTKYFCKKGALEGRYCRHVPPTKLDSLIVVQPGQYCDTYQSKPAEDTLRIHIMDIGQGDSIWIQTPDGKNVLIDGGDGGAFGKTSAGPIVTDYLNSHGFPYGSVFDAVILTHPHSDHYGGFNNIFNSSNVASYKLANYLDPMSYDDVKQYAEGKYSFELPSTYTQWFNRMKGFLAENGGARNEHVYMPAKDFFNPGDPLPEAFFGTEVQTQYITSRNTYKGDDANPASIIFKLSYKGINFLFTGDAEAEQESDAIKTGIDLSTNFLKVCHHGSSTSSTSSFLNAIWNVTKKDAVTGASLAVPESKRYALISSGRKLYSGAYIPTNQTVERLKTYMSEDHIYSTSAGDDAKVENETYRDDNILIVIKPSGSYYACYNGTN